MILQDSRYLREFPGVSREIVYNEATAVVKIYFECVEQEDLCLTFQKAYATFQDAYDEVKVFIDRESSQMTSHTTEPQSGLKAFIEAVTHNQLSLPASDYELQGDMDYLISQFG